MKAIEYLYFRIYNFFHQRNNTSPEFYTRMISMYFFSLSVGGWILFLEASYLRVFRHAWFSSKPAACVFAAGVYLLSALILHQIFIVNEHDRKIMAKYEDKWKEKPTKKRDVLISVLGITGPYILNISLAILFPHT
ncbi:MAG TPA: hypothetical protein VMI35_04390 [Puia sp.]|nr:hypothetical protein [Puia sp.]